MLLNFCFLCGMVLSFRFRVSILVPATLSAWMLVGVAGIVAASSAAMIALDIAIATVALQIGYLVGTVATAGVISIRRLRRQGWVKNPAVVR